MSAQVDSQLLHYRDCFFADAARFHPRTADIKPVAGIVAQQALSHLTTRRISSAENQHAFFLHGGLGGMGSYETAQQAGPQQSLLPASATDGFTARTKALINFPSTCAAIEVTSIPCPVRKSRASSAR